jgi:uncharacterized protein
MHPEKQREIASKGGRSVPADARAFAKDRQLAKAAGSKSRKQTRHDRTPSGNDEHPLIKSGQTLKVFRSETAAGGDSA